MKKEHVLYSFVFVAAILATVMMAHRFNVSAVVDPEAEVVDAPRTLSSEMFLGEVITLDSPWPSKIRRINLSIHFPPLYKFLTDAKPYLKLNSAQGLIKEWTLENPRQVLQLEQEMAGDEVSAELGLFYCREGDEALCLSQKVLFKIRLEPGPVFEDASLSYRVSEDIF